MKNKNKKEKNTIIMIALLAVAIVAIFAGTTYAFLTASTADNPVTNTFIAAGGGKIIDDDPTHEDPIPGTSEHSNFYLVESEATINSTKTAYTLNTAKKVRNNTYEYLVPDMTIAKDPTVTIDLADNVSAYLFLEIVDTTGGNIKATPDSSNWTEISATSYHPGGKVYLYKNSALVGNPATPAGETHTKEVDAARIFTNNQVRANTTLTDVDSNTDGTQLGTITLYAYVTQTVGFTDAISAYNQSFPRP